MKAFSVLHELWSIAMLLASSSRAGEPVAILGPSTMSQCDVKADENTYISCISILFGRFSEELRNLGSLNTKSIKSPYFLKLVSILQPPLVSTSYTMSLCRKVGTLHCAKPAFAAIQQEASQLVDDLLMEHARDRMGIYRGSHGAHIENIARTSFGTYNLIYQLGEGLTADLADDNATQEVAFAFSKGPVHYSDFRQEVSALMEQAGEQTPLIHASFWQRKLGLGTGKEFVLRLRLPAGEEALRGVIAAIADAGRAGKETIVKRGKMLLGRRVL
jgi:hypothetical protein